MKQIYILLILFSVVSAHAGNIKVVELFEPQCIRTGNNNETGAPTPACSCDLNVNETDCIPTLNSENDSMATLKTLPVCSVSLEELKADASICFDEFLPVGSKQWVHSIVFKTYLIEQN